MSAPRKPTPRTAPRAPRKSRAALDGCGHPASAKMQAVNRRLRKERSALKARTPKPMGFSALSLARTTEIARLGGLAVSHCALCDAGFPLENGWHLPAQALGMIPVTRCEKLRKRAHMARIGGKGGKARAGWRKLRSSLKGPAKLA